MGSKAWSFCIRNWKSLLFVIPVLLTFGLLLRRWSLAQQFVKAQKALRKLEDNRAIKQRMITEKDDDAVAKMTAEYEEKRDSLRAEAKALELVLDKDREAFADQMNKLWKL